MFFRDFVFNYMLVCLCVSAGGCRGQVSDSPGAVVITGNKAWVLKDHEQSLQSSSQSQDERILLFPHQLLISIAPGILRLQF